MTKYKSGFELGLWSGVSLLTRWIKRVLDCRPKVVYKRQGVEAQGEAISPPPPSRDSRSSATAPPFFVERRLLSTDVSLRCIVKLWPPHLHQHHHAKPYPSLDALAQIPLLYHTQHFLKTSF